MYFKTSMNIRKKPSNIHKCVNYSKVISNPFNFFFKEEKEKLQKKKRNKYNKTNNKI